MNEKFIKPSQIELNLGYYGFFFNDPAVTFYQNQYFFQSAAFGRLAYLISRHILKSTEFIKEVFLFIMLVPAIDLSLPSFYYICLIFWNTSKKFLKLNDKQKSVKSSLSDLTM